MQILPFALIVPLIGACVAQEAHADSSAARQPRTAPSVGEVFGRVHTSVVMIGTVGRTGPVDASGKVATEAGIGSGVLVSGEGRILTAAHVVHTADDVVVGFVDGTVLPARVIGSDPVADVAMLMLEGPPPASAAIAPLGDSDVQAIGDEVFIVGAPQGLSHTLTVGHLSARRETTSALRPHIALEQFQTDAAINQGNSGGPMFNLRGEVVGIVSYIVSTSGGSQGLGFAVTSNVCRALLMERPAMWSGMDYVFLSGDLARLLNLPEGSAGMLIQHVAKDSPAAKLGLRGGTIPVRIDDMEFLLGGDIMLKAFGIGFDEEKGIERIMQRLDALSADGAVELVYLRGGERVKVSRLRSEIW
jgi:S1-C subfamily serine protease